MNLHLTWDLFILVFFTVVTAYSFIIGRNQTLKVITSTYIAILCADGLGNLFSRYLASSESFIRFMKLFSVGNAGQATAFFKVLVLIVMVVIIAVRGLFQFEAQDNNPLSIRMAVLLVLGILSAGLMMSAMLIFVSGNSLVSNITPSSTLLADVYAQSRMVKIMVDYANLWFLGPGVGLVLLSFFNKNSA